jgi:hypothetical protein
MNSKKTKKYSVAIIGAGRIAAGFDTPKTKEVLTHAHAVTKNPNTRLIGFVDSNTAAAVAAAKRWGGQAFKMIGELWKQEKADIVIVATPNETHAQVLKTVLRFKPMLVICEKPLTTTVAHAQSVTRAYAKAKIPLLVNYSRRFDGSVQELAHAIKTKKFGNVLWASCIYSKGILHNGAHAIDTARFLFGNVKKSVALSQRKDFWQNDPTIGAHVTFDKCPSFFLMPASEREYSIFEFEVGFAKKRVRIVESGFTQYAQTPASDPRFAGYVELQKPVIKKTGLGEAMTNLLKNAVDHLHSGVKLLSPASEAVVTKQICFSLLNQAKRLT